MLTIHYTVLNGVRVCMYVCDQGKTPISHLQELCNKWGIVPLYELVASEGPIHEPVFEISVKVREYSATGKGFPFCGVTSFYFTWSII